MVKIAGGFLFRLLDLGGIRLPVHRHDQAKMSIVLRGEFTQQIGSKVFDCSDKTLLVKGAGIEHSDTYARVASCLTIDVSDPKMFDGFARATPLAPTIVARILSELRARDAASRLALEGLALELAAMAIRCEEQATAGPTAFRRACEFLADHLAGAPAMSDVAAFAGVHPSHLRRLFQTYAGCSPARWLRVRKIDAARDRLLQTDTSISGIAFELGFYDQSHFTNMFRQVTGTTPAAYRRREDV